MRGTRVAIAIAVALSAQFAAVVSFRAFVYANMYIAPDAPYGVSDVIELVLGVVLLAFGAVAVIGAVALVARGPRGNRVAGALLGSLVLVLALVLDPLHNAAAKWSARHKHLSAVLFPGLSEFSTSQLSARLTAQGLVQASLRGAA